MKPGDLVRIRNLEDCGLFLLAVVKADGYLWVAEEPHTGAMSGVWSFRSVATGARMYAFADRFERVEDEAG